MCAGWIHNLRKLREDLPLGSRLTDARTRDLWAEGDASFGGCLGPATWDLIAGGCGEEQHRLARIYEHLAADHDVLMNAERHFRERAGDRLWIWHRLQEVATNAPEHINLATLGGVELLRRGASVRCGDREAVRGGERLGIARLNREATRERRCIGTHLCTALHAAMSSDRHQASAWATDVAARKPKVDDRRNVLAAARLLCDPH